MTTMTDDSVSTLRDEKEKKGRITINQVIPPLDFSFMNMTVTAEALDEEPRKSPKKAKHVRTDSGKSATKCLKLNNNNICDYNDLRTTIEGLLDKPEELFWLDLSFNEFTKISEVLLTFSNLKILYLHGNAIQDIKEIDKLAGLRNLQKLTLHGNPTEQEKNYRLYVLEKIPQLREFDFSPVTKADRRTAATIAKFTAQPKKPKKTEDD